jgi:alkanesulfonate monooxygenase SsuD/methylene tetrahydromethanopterin reductase-like flavin-dependent oxidoreductase (luciferase family)
MIGFFSEASLNGFRRPIEYYRDLCRQIVLGDTLGYDFFATTQSYGLDFQDSTFSIVPDPLALFASQIPLTQRIKLLTAIAIAPFHHPAIALSDFALLDNLSDGRVMLGFGRGHPWLYGRLGLNQDESKARTREFFTMTRAVLDNPMGRHSHQGQFWSMEDFELLPKFVQKEPEVYMAVSVSPSSAVEAAEHRFGMLIPSYLGIPIDAVENLIATYRSHYQNRWGTSGKYLIGVNIACLPDEEEAIFWGAKALAGQLKVFSANTLDFAEKVGNDYPAYREMGQFFATFSDVDLCRDTMINEWPRYLVAWGNEKTVKKKLDELVERLQPHGLVFNIDAGGIDFSFVEQSMRYVAQTIMPSLRQKIERVS